MTNHMIAELSETQMETVSGGHCHRHHHGHNSSGNVVNLSGVLGELKGIIAALGNIAPSTNISIIIVANSTINAPLSITVNQGIKHA